MPVNEWKERYIDPRTDFGFKYLFGTPMNKQLLIGFLNANLFEAASITRFTPKQLREYEDSVKAYRDIVNAVNTARKEGREEERLEIANNLKSLGVDITGIHKATGLSPEEIEKL